MPQHDQLHRYLFENFAVRGELVTVSETLQQILENHDYPQPVKNVLAELLVATSLLTATVTFSICRIEHSHHLVLIRQNKTLRVGHFHC